MRPLTHKIGEALPGAALRILKILDLPIPSEKGPHRRIFGNLSSWGSELLDATDFIRDPDGPGWRLDRLRFDAELRDAASRSGARLLQTRIKRAVPTGKTWDVCFENGATVTVRWLIDATGRSAALARRLGVKRVPDSPLIALYAFGRPDTGGSFDRTLVEAVPEGWWYAASLPSGVPVAAFHTRPIAAARLKNLPGAWGRAVTRTRYLKTMLPVANWTPPRAAEAGGARLEQFGGNGWLACGDAALAFDPISAQGILSALYTAKLAGETVVAALENEDAALARYTAQVDSIRRTYLVNRRKIYAGEDRWAARAFWAEQRDVANDVRGLGKPARRLTYFGSPAD